MQPTAHKNFIVFEGCEGCGKSTQARLLTAALQEEEGKAVWLTHEPGGTEFGRQVRELLLKGKGKEGAIDALTEFFLFEADRHEHVREIQKHLNAGEIVISDRFSFSSFAYQGYARGLFPEYTSMMMEADRAACVGIYPELVLFLDHADIGVCLERKHKQKEFNRFEAEERAFHERVRAGFLALAKDDTVSTWRIIDAARSIEEIAADIRGEIKVRFF